MELGGTIRTGELEGRLLGRSLTGYIIDIRPNQRWSPHSLALPRGRYLPWGYNGYGELGIGSTTNAAYPTSSAALIR